MFSLKKVSPVQAESARNIRLLYAKGATISISLLFSGGVLMQTFLKSSGIDDGLIGIYTMALNIASSAAILFGAGFFDRLKNQKRFLTLMLLFMVFPFAVLSPLCFSGADIRVIFTVAFITCVFQNLFYGCRNVLEYKFVYLIIDMRNYSKVVSLDSIVSGIAGIAVTSVFSAVVGLIEFKILMGIMFALGAVMLLLAAFCNSQIRVINEAPDIIERKSAGGNLRMLLVFILPSACRGFGQGGIAMLSLIGFADGGLTERTASILALAATVAAISGGLLYFFLVRFVSPLFICISTQIIIMLLLPLMILGASPALFIGAYFVIQLCLICAGFSIPVLITRFVPFDFMGRFTSMRMLTMTVSSAASNALVGLLIGKLSSFVLLAAMGIFMGASGILHFALSSYYIKSNKERS